MKMTRRSAIPLLAASPAAFQSLGAAAPSAGARLFIGTYTSPAGSIPGAQGIYTSSWNAATGELTPPELAAATPDPTFLAVSPKLPDRLFAVNELGHDQTGTVTTFARTAGTGKLSPINTVDSGGKGPCHLTLDQTAQALYVANYPSGSIASYKVTPEGLSAPIANIHYTGSGPKPEQTSPHAHCVNLSPDNRFLLVNDLGTDRILIYRVDPARATLTPAAVPFVSVAPGSGPRHTLFHPNGRWLYNLNELGSTIILFDWSAEDGVLTPRGTVSTLPEEARGKKNNAAELAIDSSGKFLYCSNRFHDSIAVFSIDPANGTLTVIQDIPCGGKVPRSFALDPSGRWLLTANQDTANIAVFARNPATGLLTPTSKTYSVNRPVCLLFA